MNSVEINFKEQLILIVDDNPSNLSVLVDYLEDCGLTTRVATSGELTLQRAERIQPVLILLDVMMPPGIDGFETCRQLKENEKTKDIPVIFMTALSSTEDKVKGFSVGGVDYITKPIQQEEVLARITTHLRLRSLTMRLNTKVEELTQTRHELVQSEIMASLGRLVAGFAHELNTPLGVAVGSASTVKREIKKVNNIMEQEEIDVDNLLSSLDSINKGFDLTLSNLKRAANLVTSFKRTAVDQSSDEVRIFYIH
ncbi:MAG: response regulator, partial [Thiomargarita sp.]|nr:response regulator [Thiomargarita sp.]